MVNAPIAAFQHQKDRHKKDAPIPRSSVKPAAGRRAMAVVDQLGRRVMKEYTVEVYEDGSKRWYLDGKLHREDGPAFEHANGRKDWYLNGERHREDGPAIEWADGTKFWYLNGQRHREDGPAVEWSDGSKEWRVKGQLHREDGPAVEWSDGTKKWWLHNKRVTEEEHKRRMSAKAKGEEQ